jgi:hypothetical protein
MMMRFIPVLFLACILFSCSSVPREGWSVTGPELTKGAEFRLLSGDDGVRRISIVSPYFGEGVELLGEVVSPGGAAAVRPDAAVPYEIEFVELRYFGNWRRGWTEATFEASGRIVLSFEGGRWHCRIVEPPAIGGVKSAKVRYMDSFLSGDQAIEAVRHRMERIEAAVMVWREDEHTWFERPLKEKRRFARDRGRNFADTAGPVFFPEVYGYPSGSWKEGPWARGDGRNWDTAYTASRFPEQLRDVRDSGTLYRDWEEGLHLWYLVAQWPPFWEEKFPAGEISILNVEGDEK